MYGADTPAKSPAAPETALQSPAAPADDASMSSYENKPIALLQGLDKITARVSELKVPIGVEAGFGSLKITVQACKKSSPLDPPEAAAFLQITEQKKGEKTVASVFSGWMFASSPALSAMEHPVYDIWVKDCVDAK